MTRGKSKKKWIEKHYKGDYRKCARYELEGRGICILTTCYRMGDEGESQGS